MNAHRYRTLDNFAYCACGTWFTQRDPEELLWGAHMQKAFIFEHLAPIAAAHEQALHPPTMPSTTPATFDTTP